MRILSLLGVLTAKLDPFLRTQFQFLSETINPNSPDGKTISKSEKEKIYKAIRDVEEKISNLKLSIGIK